MVKITSISGSHNNLVFLTGSFNTSLFSTPRHYRSIRGKPPFQNLIPADDITPFTIHESLHPMNKPTLQSLFIFQSFTLHQCLAMAAFLPRFLRTLIATDMNVMTGKQLHNLCQYIFQKSECIFFRAIDFIKDIKIIAYNVRFPQSAREFRISRQCSGSVSRHFNFRNNGNKTVGGIFHDFFYIFLRIEPSLFFSVETPRIIVVAMPYLGLVAMRADFNKSGVFLNLYPPPLVIRQMKMKLIEFIHGHQVEKLQHLFFRLKITAYVHHGPAMGKPGNICHVDCWYFYLSIILPAGIINLRRHKLQQRLDSIKQSCCSFIGTYFYATGGNIQCVSLIRQ